MSKVSVVDSFLGSSRPNDRTSARLLFAMTHIHSIAVLAVTVITAINVSTHFIRCICHLRSITSPSPTRQKWSLLPLLTNLQHQPPPQPKSDELPVRLVQLCPASHPSSHRLVVEPVTKAVSPSVRQRFIQSDHDQNHERVVRHTTCHPIPRTTPRPYVAKQYYCIALLVWHSETNDLPVEPSLLSFVVVFTSLQDSQPRRQHFDTWTTELSL